MAESYGTWGAIAVTLGLTLWNSLKKSGFSKGQASERNKQFIELQLATTQHFKDCDKRHIANATMAAEVKEVQKDVEYIKKDNRWQGDCLVTIATAMSVRLPERPQ